MKITMVTHSMYPESIGGREKYVYYLANSLGKRGHEVRVFSCAQSGRSRTSHHKNFTTFYFPSVDIPLKTAKYRIPIMLLLKLLQDDSDVIHACIISQHLSARCQQESKKRDLSSQSTVIRPLKVL